MHEAESESYQRIKNGDKVNQPKDDGLDHRKNKEKKDGREAKKNSKASKRGALNASNMHYHADEKHIQEYYTKGFKDLVVKEKGELSIADSLIIDVLAYAAVRLYRKSRLESSFGRFMDRTAPQDPLNQILQCIKSLGLKSTAKPGESGKDLIGKLLASDITGEGEEENQVMNFDEWKKAQVASGIPKIRRRAMDEFAEDESKYSITLGEEAPEL